MQDDASKRMIAALRAINAETDAEREARGCTKVWVEPLYVEYDRINSDVAFCLMPVWFGAIFGLKYLLFGFFDRAWIDVVLGFMTAAASFFISILIITLAGQKKVLSSPGHWQWVEPPPKVLPIYPTYPQENFGPSSDTTYGSAHWNNPRKIKDIFGPVQDEGDGFLINATTRVGQPMHGVIIAGTGQGKGVSIILPNLLSQPRCSWFVLDPKGENAQISARWQREAGQKVYILDPWNEQKRLGATHGIQPCGCNPLSFIQGNPNEIPESCAAVAAMIAPDEAQAKDPYWNGRARTLIKTYLLHLLTARPKEEQHLGTIYDWLRYDEAERTALWVAMRLNTALNRAVIKGINQFFDMDTDKGPLPSILSNAHEHTEFMESEALRESLSKYNFDPYELADGKTTVYLCLPERYLKSHSKWLRLIVCVCLKSCNFRPDKRVNFVLDEFAILGKMPDVQDAYAYSRGQGVCMFSFVQSLAQLLDIYGQHGTDALLANARLRQFFGIFDLGTQRYLSEYLGDRTVMAISKGTSETIGGSFGTSWSTSSGSSSSYSDNGNGTSSHSSGTSNSTSQTDSEGTSWSHSKSENETPVGRRLLTADEVGKSNDIITLIDGYKYHLPRIPFWANYQELIQSGKIKWFPSNYAEWKRHCEIQWGWYPPDPDIVGDRFRPRADGHLVRAGADQKK